MTQFFRSLLASLALCISAVCIAGITNVDDEDNGTTITVNPGDLVVVRLLSNPSTGYSWSIGMNNSDLLQQIGKAKNIGSGGDPGSGGMTEFRFKAVGSGGDTLALLYQKPWEKGVQAAKTFRIFVVINRGGGQNGRGVTVNVYDHDNDGQVDLREGDFLVVNLSANRTTGYSWNMSLANLAGVLQLVSSRYDPSPSGLMGSGGTQIYKYRVIGGGQGFLQGAYQRPNSGGIRAAKTWEILVNAQRRGAPLLGGGG